MEASFWDHVRGEVLGHRVMELCTSNRLHNSASRCGVGGRSRTIHHECRAWSRDFHRPQEREELCRMLARTKKT